MTQIKPGIFQLSLNKVESAETGNNLTMFEDLVGSSKADILQLKQLSNGSMPCIGKLSNSKNNGFDSPEKSSLLSRRKKA